MRRLIAAIGLLFLAGCHRAASSAHPASSSEPTATTALRIDLGGEKLPVRSEEVPSGYFDMSTGPLSHNGLEIVLTSCQLEARNDRGPDLYIELAVTNRNPRSVRMSEAGTDDIALAGGRKYSPPFFGHLKDYVLTRPNGRRLTPAAFSYRQPLKPGVESVVANPRLAPDESQLVTLEYPPVPEGERLKLVIPASMFGQSDYNLLLCMPAIPAFPNPMH